MQISTLGRLGCELNINGAIRDRDFPFLKGGRWRIGVFPRESGEAVLILGVASFTWLQKNTPRKGISRVQI